MKFIIAFLLFDAGIRVSYDMSKPEGSRVVDLRVRCSKCRIPKFGPISKTTTYKVQ